MKQALFDTASIRPEEGWTPFLAFRSFEHRLDDYLHGGANGVPASRDAGNPLMVSGPAGFCVFPDIYHLTTHPDSPLGDVDVVDMWDEDGRLFAADPARGERSAVEIRQLTDHGIDVLKGIAAGDRKLSLALPWFDSRGYAEAGPRALDSIWRLWDDPVCCHAPRCADGMSTRMSSTAGAVRSPESRTIDDPTSAMAEGMDPADPVSLSLDGASMGGLTL